MDSVSILVKTVLESELKMLDVTTPEACASDIRAEVKLWIERRLKQLEKNDNDQSDVDNC